MIMVFIKTIHYIYAIISIVLPFTVTLPPEFFENLWQPDLYLNAKETGKTFYNHVVKLFAAIFPQP